jgi:hypothetical protein
MKGGKLKFWNGEKTRVQATEGLEIEDASFGVHWISRFPVDNIQTLPQP